MLQRVDLHLEPNEASDLTQIHEPGLLAAHGWDSAFLTVLDEGPVEDCIAVLGHDAGAGPVEGWCSKRMKFAATKAMKGRTEDAEAVAVRDGVVYVVGSHYGSKDGPLEPKRHWLARFDQSELAQGLKDCKPDLEIVRTKFRLHRAVNDALKASGVELFALGDAPREALVEATLEDGRKRGKAWVERVREDDLPSTSRGRPSCPTAGSRSACASRRRATAGRCSSGSGTSTPSSPSRTRPAARCGSSRPPAPAGSPSGSARWTPTTSSSARSTRWARTPSSSTRTRTRARPRASTGAAARCPTAAGRSPPSSCTTSATCAASRAWPPARAGTSTTCRPDSRVEMRFLLAE
jgi:hypothetical protein